MLTAISRYGARVLPNTRQIIAGCKSRDELIQGPHLAQFEAAFAQRAGVEPLQAIAAAYGRMAFYYILQALGLPGGSEIVVPALTFWVIPELARVAGLRVVFADVDPATFTLDPAAFERAITPATRAVVPTHLYGLPCDMDAITAIAGGRGIHVIEDCAHALGAAYRGRPVGSFGDAAFFSFQTLKPLNCYGGGMAIVRDRTIAARVRARAERGAWPEVKRVDNRLLVGRLQRTFIRPRVFTFTAFPILWVSSLVGGNPDVYLWEKIRPLDPLPDAYTERFPNVQAAIGLAGLEKLDEWTALTRHHAKMMDEALGDLPGIAIPRVPAGCTHVYYQYCVYGPKRDEVVMACVRRGVDVETLHVDVCSDMELFAGAKVFPEGAPGARRAAGALQIPVYSTLTADQVRRVARVVREALVKSTRNRS